MARQARILSEYLHVIVRGIGKQILFEDDIDRKYFLSLLRRNKDECRISILAYCLMDNHVHLLLKDESSNVSLFMKKIGIRYAGYYNRKYDRVGHLFQDRFKSEPIIDDRGVLAVYRYILNNPKKAGIAEASTFAWNSYHEYDRKDGITDSSMFKAMIGNKDMLKDFLSVPDESEFMEDEAVKHDDSWAAKTIRDIVGPSGGTALQSMGRAERDKMLVKLKSAGISVRQLERLTGINRGVINKAKVDNQNRPQ